MAGKAFDMLGKPLWIELLNRCYHGGMQACPMLTKQQAVCDLVGQGMLKGVCWLRI